MTRSHLFARLAVLAFGILLITACGSSAKKKAGFCQGDGECGTSICLAGQCVELASCSTTSDCGGNGICVDSKCWNEQCQSDTQCAYGTCVSGYCVRESSQLGTDTSDGTTGSEDGVNSGDILSEDQSTPTTKMVPCRSDLTRPANSQDVVVDVSVSYDPKTQSWSDAAFCAWTCKANFCLDQGACIGEKLVDCVALATVPTGYVNGGTKHKVSCQPDGSFSAAPQCQLVCDVANGFCRDGASCVKEIESPCSANKTLPSGRVDDVQLVKRACQLDGTFAPASTCATKCDTASNYCADGEQCVKTKQQQCDNSGTPPIGEKYLIAAVSTTCQQSGTFSAPAVCQTECDLANGYCKDGNSCLKSKSVACTQQKAPTGWINQTENVDVQCDTTFGTFEPAADCKLVCDTANDYCADGQQCVKSKQAQCALDPSPPTGWINDVQSVTLTCTQGKFSSPTTCSLKCDTANDYCSSSGQCVKSADFWCLHDTQLKTGETYVDKQHTLACQAGSFPSTPSCAVTCDNANGYCAEPQTGVCKTAIDVSCDTNNGNPANSTDVVATVSTSCNKTSGSFDPPTKCAWKCNTGFVQLGQTCVRPDNCRALQQFDSQLASGVYLIDHQGRGEETVYCDMDNGGLTILFGYGSFDKTYPGWSAIGAPLLRNTTFHKPFVDTYNANKGLKNLDPSFVHNANCAFANIPWGFLYFENPADPQNPIGMIGPAQGGFMFCSGDEPITAPYVTFAGGGSPFTSPPANTYPELYPLKDTFLADNVPADPPPPIDASPIQQPGIFLQIMGLKDCSEVFALGLQNGYYFIADSDPGKQYQRLVLCEKDPQTGGMTVTTFGFGAFTQSYSGYRIMGISDFADTSPLQTLFITYYNLNAGIDNLSPGFTISGNNCCLKGDTNGGSITMMRFGDHLATFFDAADSKQFCTGSTPRKVLIADYTETTPYLPLAPPAPISQQQNYFQWRPPTQDACLVGNNPAFFVRQGAN